MLRRVPLAALVAMLVMGIAVAQQAPPETDPATNQTPDEAVEDDAYREPAGQIYGSVILLAVVAIGLVLAVMMVKQHWRFRGRR